MSQNPNSIATGAFVAALVASGVRHACITPGSRSTPLTVAFARHPGIKVWLHLDERSSSFFALGLARATAAPVALVCTSGTAASNYHPAVVEANQSRIPLIVCTADRPQRLRDVGADQTIDQVRMFGSNVRWAMDLALPSPSGPAPRYFEGCADRAVRSAMAPLPGPVHLNFPFEEPLLPPPGELTTHANGSTPSSAAIRPVSVAPDVDSVSAAVAALRGARRPMIVAGPETGGLPADAIVALAARLDAPVLADPLSGVRLGPHDRSRVLDSYDAIVRDPRATNLPPDAVIRFGGVPTSKALNQLLAGLGGTTQILCDHWGSWRDPEQVSTHVVHGDAGLVADALAEGVSGPGDPGWLSAWVERNGRARDAMQAATASFAEPFEGRVFTELQSALPAGTTVVVGNSMPVRDADSFLVSDAKPLAIVGNRGVNGIDGMTSTALGAAAAATGPVVMVIGDVSFYHDLNGLWAAKRHNLDLTIVLVNNNGGGIFHYLPQAAHDDIFEEWFGTPPDLDFAPVIGMYGGRHVVVQDWRSFAGAASRPPAGLTVLELRTNRAANTAMHRQAWSAAAEAAWGAATVAR